jgi:hypothetical protein
VVEAARAWLGAGRSLVRSGAPGSGPLLERARDVWSRLGAGPLLDETRRWLDDDTG